MLNRLWNVYDNVEAWTEDIVRLGYLVGLTLCTHAADDLTEMLENQYASWVAAHPNTTEEPDRAAA